MLGSDTSGNTDTVNGAIYQLLKILIVVIRAHNVRAECRLIPGMYTILALIVNFK